MGRLPDVSQRYPEVRAREEEWISDLQRWVRQRTISNTGEGLEEGAGYLARYLEEVGFDSVTIVPIGRTRWGQEAAPVVVGRMDAGAAKTLLVYMMYDTMPAGDERAWIAPPFEGRIMSAFGFDAVLLGRGAVNSKGPQAAFLSALKVLRKHGALPVNIVLVAEGDEERMSIGIQEFVARHADMVRAADAALMVMIQTRSGTARPAFGSEGCLYVELETSGRAWGRGPTEHDIHGIFKRQVDSPAWRHIHMLSTITADHGNTVLIEGWRDDLEPPSAEDLRRLDAVLPYMDTESIKQATKVRRFINDLEGRELLRRSLYEPTFNLDGIWGGLTTPGTAGSIVPHRLVSKHNCRYYANQRGDRLLHLLRAHLDRHGYSDVEVRVIGDVDWLKPRYDTEIADAVFAMYRESGVPYLLLPAPGLIAMAPYWPAAALGKPPLSLPVASGGLGYGAHQHAPNEYFVIRGDDRVCGLVEAVLGHILILERYGGG
ncbi:MAG: M20/M25/M40 family metallo-hydrolase [Armatimonadetes bacterium]|nr:M20/M25/M40 family metallo-hydrolase [Armatimonadota bacterium]